MRLLILRSLCYRIIPLIYHADWIVIGRYRHRFLPIHLLTRRWIACVMILSQSYQRAIMGHSNWRGYYQGHDTHQQGEKVIRIWVLWIIMVLNLPNCLWYQLILVLTLILILILILILMLMLMLILTLTLPKDHFLHHLIILR